MITDFKSPVDLSRECRRIQRKLRDALAVHLQEVPMFLLVQQKYVPSQKEIAEDLISGRGAKYYGS